MDRRPLSSIDFDQLAQKIASFFIDHDIDDFRAGFRGTNRIDPARQRCFSGPEFHAIPGSKSGRLGKPESRQPAVVARKVNDRRRLAAIDDHFTGTNVHRRNHAVEWRHDFRIVQVDFRLFQFCPGAQPGALGDIVVDPRLLQIRLRQHRAVEKLPGAIQRPSRLLGAAFQTL